MVGPWRAANPAQGSGGIVGPCPESPAQGSGCIVGPWRAATPAHGSGGIVGPCPESPAQGSGGIVGPWPESPAQGSGGIVGPWRAANPAHESGDTVGPCPAIAKGSANRERRTVNVNLFGKNRRILKTPLARRLRAALCLAASEQQVGIKRTNTEGLSSTVIGNCLASVSGINPTIGPQV
jgi:hypothetical protein